jgi:putative hydrolase of the HAD superfamily
MNIRGIFFDINGTLIDIKTDENNEEIYRAVGHFLSYQGIAIHRGELHDLYFRILGKQHRESQERYPEFDMAAIFREIIETCATDFTRSLSGQWLEQLPVFIAQVYRGISRLRLEPYPHVREVLDQLRGDFALGIVSDAQSVAAVPELNAAGLLEYFSPIIISGDYGYRKPDARLFQKALEASELDTESVIFVGNDMYHDIFGAQQLGIKTVFVDSNQGTKEMEGVEPHYIIRDFAQLIDAIRFFEDGN